ncbi:alpha/beta fold hydrolase [Streptomyces sp. NPDC001663]|uniref:alpha/beta fold hydrolase n=1 Tax=Streptomyces sp. NPDC001663 TaxID=3364597 RepID=UPI0036759B4F
MSDGMLRVDGAELYYEIRGSGPALLLISGAGGDAGYFSGMAEELADAFTVINYDRRGNSRSTGRVAAPMTVAQQASDARALIDALAGGRALIFGNSGGAIIGLALAAQHPEVVAGLIAHEPPIVSLLPDGDPHRDFFTDLAKRYADSGAEAAAGQFVQSVRGEGTYAWPDDLTKRFLDNADHLLSREMAAFGGFRPDEAALSAAPFPIVLGAGSADRGLSYARPSIELARRLGVPWAEFPGIHLEFIPRPALFAAAVRILATQMHSGAAAVPAHWENPAR